MGGTCSTDGKENKNKMLVGNPHGRRPLDRPKLYGRIPSKWEMKVWSEMVWFSVGCCDHDDRPSGSLLRNFFIIWVTISCRRKALFLGVVYSKSLNFTFVFIKLVCFFRERRQKQLIFTRFLLCRLLCKYGVNRVTKFWVRSFPVRRVTLLFQHESAK
jgi:hypothetical protein